MKTKKENQKAGEPTVDEIMVTDEVLDEALAEKGLKIGLMPAFPFTDRERFIQIMSVMVTSKIAKKIPRDARRSIIDYLRKKFCPSITDQVWDEIRITMDHNNMVIMASMLKGTALSMEIEASTICNNCGYVKNSDEVIA